MYQNKIMRYQEYLKEETYNPHAKRLLPGMQTVYTHCMPYIKDLVKNGYSYLKKSDDLLYSGRKDDQLVINKYVRNDRNPTDTNYDLHLLYDKEFYKLFKVKSRSNAIFCTGSYISAGGYGNNVYIIFPAGKYEVVWSDNIRDLYSSDADRIIARWKSKYKIHRDRKLIKTNLSDIDKELKKLPYNFIENLSSIPDNNEFKKGLMKELHKEIFSTYHKGDIMKAINSNHEIMLTCKYYIGLKYIDFNRTIKQYIDQMKTTYPTEEIYYKWYEQYIG